MSSSNHIIIRSTHPIWNISKRKKDGKIDRKINKEKERKRERDVITN